MSEWLNQAITQAQGVSDWLSPKRDLALSALADIRWPTRKTEAWKYTSLRPVEKFSKEAPAAFSSTSTLTQIQGFECLDLVFENGQFVTDLAALTLPEGLSIQLASQADASKQAEVLAKFSSIKPERHVFGLLNDALVQDVLVIEVADNVSVAPAIRLTSILGLAAQAHTRVLVVLGEHAKLTVSEHYRFALQTGKAVSLGGSHFQLAERADLNSTLVGFGSDLSRVDVDMVHAGENAFAKMNAFYLLDGKELFDLHATVEHAVPHGTTEENIRIIAADQAKAVFNGRIHIHRDAQKTLAELNNRNLLMSNKAEINTKPELEIYADDVRCAHGATVAEIDKKALYYMQSRGISRAKAQVMLNFGFINELIDQMPNQELAEWLRPQMREKFSQMEVK
jgi:Fe-S cluster assembly protein SufD